MIWEDNGSSSLNGEDVLKNQSTKIRGKKITQQRTKAPTLVWHCEIGSIIPQQSQVWINERVNVKGGLDELYI